MNKSNDFPLIPSSMDEEIIRLRAEIDRLRAEREALSFSESVQKDLASNLQAKLDVLKEQNDANLQELEEAKKKIESLVPMQQQHDIRCFATSWFSVCFSILQLSQEILVKLFPDDQTVHATVSGPTIRKMFESVTHSHLPLNFFDSGDSIDIKVHTGIDQFMEFCLTFTKFIYAANIELPGSDFIVCSIKQPRKVKRVLSNDGQLVYEFVNFVVSFYCRNTRKKYKIVFSCDAGHSFPQEGFDVDSITFDAIRGFDARAQGSQISVLQIIMGIVNRRAQWYREPNAHFSGFKRVLDLLRTRMYVLHGCPFVSKTDFCPFLQGASKYALEFSGCSCNQDRIVSIGMFCGFLRSNPDSPLRCPFCKDVLQNLTHEPDCAPESFDLSCIDHENVLNPDELLVLQEDGMSVPRIFGLAESPPSEIDEIRDQLSSFQKVGHRWSRLPPLPELQADDAALFFPHNPIEDSDADPEPESDDDDDDQADQADQADQGYQDDQADQGYQDDQADQGYQDDQADQGYQDDQDDQADQADSDDEDYQDDLNDSEYEVHYESDNGDEAELIVQVQPIDPDDYQENQGYQNQPRQ